MTDWETQAGTLEDDARKTAEEWEAKVVEEKRCVRDVQFDLKKSQTKMKGMELELTELRNSCAKIDEYEQVLRKLMERKEELEMEAKGAKDGLDFAERQVELADRRRTVKVKDLEEKIEEQRQAQAWSSLVCCSNGHIFHHQTWWTRIWLLSIQWVRILFHFWSRVLSTVQCHNMVS